MDTFTLVLFGPNEISSSRDVAKFDESEIMHILNSAGPIFAGNEFFGYFCFQLKIFLLRFIQKTYLKRELFLNFA